MTSYFYDVTFGRVDDFVYAHGVQNRSIAVMEPEKVQTRTQVCVPLIPVDRGLPKSVDNFARFPVQTECGTPLEIWLSMYAFADSKTLCKLTPVMCALRGAHSPVEFVNMTEDGRSAIVRILVNVRAEASERFGKRKNCSLEATVSAMLVVQATQRVLASGFVTLMLVPKHQKVEQYCSALKNVSPTRSPRPVCASLVHCASSVKPPASPQKRRRLVDFVAESVVQPSLGKRLTFEGPA